MSLLGFLNSYLVIGKKHKSKKSDAEDGTFLYAGYLNVRYGKHLKK